MAIPEYPITRREQYLDAIATNDTSALPAEPITRTEQYLDAIARNGGGSGGGSGGGVLVCTVDETTGTLDHTWQEISDAPFAVVDADGRRALIIGSQQAGGQFVVMIAYPGSINESAGTMSWGILFAVADSPNGYPVVEEDDGGGDDSGGTA